MDDEQQDNSPELYEQDDSSNEIVLEASEQLELDAATLPENRQVDENAIDEVVFRPNYEIEINTHAKDTGHMRKISHMVEVIQRDNHFATDSENRQLYVFMTKGKYAGTYIEASRSIDLAIKQLSEHHEYVEDWSKHTKRREVYNLINIGLPELEEPDTRHLNVNNGLIYLAPNGSFIAHSEEWSADNLTTIKIPVNYNPDATCPAWEKFISEVFPVDAQHIAWEIVALMMLPLRNKAASAIILKGPSNTGKSTFLNNLETFLGKTNVSHLSLDMFGERFQDAVLKGKLANIVGELPRTRLGVRALNTIKKLIGNDPLMGEVKGGHPFYFKSYARCIFACNDMPMCEHDEAFFDRFLIIPFDRQQFSKNPVKEAQINDALSHPDELSGLLNKALEALPSVVQRGILPTFSLTHAHDDVVLENDSLRQWVMDTVTFDKEQYVLFNDLHDAYKKAEPRDNNRQSSIRFGKDVKDILLDMTTLRGLPMIVKNQVRHGGIRHYCYRGITLVGIEEALDDTNFQEFDLESLTDNDVNGE